MGLRWDNIFWLGTKELRGLRADPVLLFLIAYAFSVAVYMMATGSKTEVENAAVGIVDEDHSELSRRIALAVFEPMFRPPVEITADKIDPSMNSGRFVFVIEVPPKFEFDVLAGRRPIVQVDVDATAMTLAGNGLSYLQDIIAREAQSYVGRNEGTITQPINLVTRAKFNPNLESEWFYAVMSIVNIVTMLTVILTGAALIREREHGTIEHLLVMPVKPAEIMIAKFWANGLVIVVAALLSLWLNVHGLLHVPIAGSMMLFIFGAVLYVVSVAALGILLATFTGTMGQFGLLAIAVVIALNLLSGGTTPIESMPKLLQDVMQVTPTTHFISFAQAVLFRSAGLDIVWPQLAALAAAALGFFAISLMRFRTAIVSFQ
jgi:ABC-2 type transport system permease protein